MSVVTGVVLFKSKMPSMAMVAERAGQLGYELQFSDRPEFTSAEQTISASTSSESVRVDVVLEAATALDWMPDELRPHGDQVLVFRHYLGVESLVFGLRLQRIVAELAGGAWWYLDHDDQFATPDGARARLDDEIKSIEARIACEGSEPSGPTVQQGDRSKAKRDPSQSSKVGFFSRLLGRK